MRLETGRGISSAVREAVFLLRLMPAGFGSTKMARRSLRRAEPEQECELMAESRFMRQISIAKAARATSAHGISLAEQAKVRSSIPMRVVFGLTKISQRTPAQSAMGPAENHRTLVKNLRAESLSTVPVA